MHLHGYYRRYADELWRCEKIPIRRYRCRACRVTFSYPPSFLRPYRSALVWLQEWAARLWASGCRCGAWGIATAGLSRRQKGGATVFAAVRVTVLPEFYVDVYPTYEQERAPHQRYILTLRDETDGGLELLFPSPQDLRAFLTIAREAFASARQEAKGRKARQQRVGLSHYLAARERFLQKCTSV